MSANDIKKYRLLGKSYIRLLAVIRTTVVFLKFCKRIAFQENSEKKKSAFNRVSAKSWLGIIPIAILHAGCAGPEQPHDSAEHVIKKRITLDIGNRCQTIDGFGVNITPAQWHEGKLKPLLDNLIDSLGCTLIRFDCYGRANWLDPQKQLPDGNYSSDYLKQIYTGKTFRDAWAVFRYLNSKGIQPIFNISGAVPGEWVSGKKDDQRRLKDFDAYASMAVSLLDWARNKEGLQFSYFMPFNETDLGFPEGPKLKDEDCVPALNAILKRLKKSGLSDIRCIIMDDANVHTERLKMIFENLRDTMSIKGIGVHTYGNGAEEDLSGWPGSVSLFRQASDLMQSEGFKSKSFLLTEYGDLDQSGEIEYEIGWRSTRRLLKCLNDGMTGGIAWDAFDNFHQHDTAWAKYGLFKTDTGSWTYTPKERYYAAKQVYKYVSPGFQRIGIIPPAADSNYVYKEWVRTLRNMSITAFISPDGRSFTLVGLNNVEGDVELEVDLSSFGKFINNTKANYYLTCDTLRCKKMTSVTIEQKIVKILIPKHSIFTLTNLQEQ